MKRAPRLLLLMIVCVPWFSCTPSGSNTSAHQFDTVTFDLMNPPSVTEKAVAEILEGPMEIISLGRTLSQSGSHLHISVSDATGKVAAGHLTQGSVVNTMAEIVLGILPDWRFTRATDPATGFAELLAKRVRPGEAGSSR